MTAFVLPVTLSATDHARERQRRRGITDDQLELTLHYGTRVHTGGAVVYYLRLRDIPRWVGDDYAARARGTVAVVSAEGAILTSYRNPKALHRLKKRPRWDTRHARAI